MKWALPGMFPNKVAFMENGVIVEEGPSIMFFDHPKEARTRAFLRMVDGIRAPRLILAGNKSKKGMIEHA